MHRQPDQAEHDSTPLAPPAQVDAAAERATSAGPAGKLPLTARAVTIPASLLGAAKERIATEMAAPEPDRRIAGLRARLEEVQQRAEGAKSWLETSEDYRRLLNSAGFVPVTARFDARDLMFLGQAREDLLGFAELGLRLTELHRPLDAGGTSSDPANPGLRCRSCMWRWPCPTFRTMTEILTERGPAAPA